MRFETLLLALMVTLMAIAPSQAIRGSRNQMVASQRSLQDASDTAPADKEPKEAKEDKAEKVDKDSTATKKSDSKKSKKKDKKACKKADKKDKKKRRGLQDDVSESESFDGDVADLEYCSQGELSAAQCSNLDAIPADGKVVSLLKLHLVHDDVKEPEDITEEAEGILDSGDTELRFVGCKDMDAPPPPPKKGDSKKKGSVSSQEDDSVRRQRRARSNRRRKLPADDESHEVDFKSDEEKIDVTGVDFNNLKIVKNGCDASTDGTVCDVIESDVDIFYQSYLGQDPSDEDKEDMHNLLIETIMKQANAGAFGSLGTVENVEVSQGSGGGLFRSSGSGGSNSILPIVLGVVAALVAVGCLYWFCCRGGDEEGDVNHKAHNEDTSDEEHSSDEEDNRGLPVAEVVQVQDDPANAKKGTYAKEKK